MSLILDGQEMQRSNDGVYLSLARGRGRLEPPPTRRVRTLIPFRAGRRVEHGHADIRVLELTGWLKKPAPQELVDELDALKQLLDPARDPWILRDFLPTGETRWIEVVGRNLMGTYLNPHTYQLSVELETAEDPHWHAPHGIATMDSGLLMDDGEHMDQGGSTTVMPTSVSHALTIESPSTAEIERIRLRMVGPSITAPGIEADTPDGAVGFVMADALATDEVLDIDNWERVVAIGGITQRAEMTLRAANRHGEYIRLRPGQNTVRVLGMPASARLHFPLTFL